MWEGRWCEQCEKRHTAMEMCPHLPGIIEGWRLWLKGDPVGLRAVLVTLVLVGLAAYSAFSMLH
jgi:hypothetical protein